MKTLISLAAAAALGLSLSACNTMSGVGKDVAAGGEKIQDASAKVRGEWRDWRARHDNDYDGARGTCGAGSDADRAACRDRIRAEYRAKNEEARARYHRAEMKSMTERERMEDAYETARDSCYSMRGADEDRCLAHAKTMQPRQ
ncbi:MAG: entericidin A/B family lipoprotein [Casimicrobiaceae bacterium]